MTTADPLPAAPKPRRRWSLSVRGLMLLVLVIGAPIGWEVNRVTRLRQARAVLERCVVVPAVDLALGPARPPDLSSVDLEFNSSGMSALRACGLQWFVDRGSAWLPEEYFEQVVGVRFYRRPTASDWDAIKTLRSVDRLGFSGVRVTDADLDHLANAAGLSELDLSHTSITDRTVANLGRVHTLRVLYLSMTDVTDAGLAPLAGLPRLEVLQIPDHAGTDAGFGHLREMRSLRILDVEGLSGTVSDAGLIYLRQMDRLEELRFVAGHVTDAGMAILEGLPRLKLLDIATSLPEPRDDGELDFSQDGILALSPAGIERLDRFAHLETLSLRSLAAIDDAWLRSIGRLNTLRKLSVGGKSITDAGLAPLGHLLGLTRLLIMSPGVTDAGLIHLRPLTQLTSLSFYAKVSDLGLANMQAAMPLLKEVHNMQSVAPSTTVNAVPAVPSPSDPTLGEIPLPVPTAPPL